MFTRLKTLFRNWPKEKQSTPSHRTRITVSVCPDWDMTAVSTTTTVQASDSRSFAESIRCTIPETASGALATWRTTCRLKL